MRVNEIFLSIEGEGIRTGQTSVFIRLQGCNLKCSFCDTRYACEGDDYTDMSIRQILEKVESYNCPRVTVTGGEPLLYDSGTELISELGKHYEVNIETNGSIYLGIPIKKFKKCFNIDDHLIITMDWKPISSGVQNYMVNDNLRLLRPEDVLKFVVGNKDDLDQMKRIVQHYKLDCNIFVSPVFGKIEPKEIVEYVINNNLHQVTTQVQLHKIIWNPSMRGV